MERMYVVTFDARPVTPYGVLGLRRMTLDQARQVMRIAARIPKSGRIVNAATLEVVSE